MEQYKIVEAVSEKIISEENVKQFIFGGNRP